MEKGALEKKVKGTFFVDYVRMLRAKKGVDWSQYLEPGDMRYLSERIIETEWYPFDAFERMGLAVLTETAGGSMEPVHLWGRAIVDRMFSVHRSLICDNNPKESMIRFQVARGNLFNFDPVHVLVILDNYSKIELAYGMGRKAEEAACRQAAGYFERLLELAGATNVSHRFTRRAWDGAPSTILEFEWSMFQKDRKIKGSFLSQYVRMIRARKDVDWTEYLRPEDLEIVNSTVDPKEWRPFESFERIATAIFHEVALGDMSRVRIYGRHYVNQMHEQSRELICEGDPRETLMRFEVTRRSFFNFDPVVLTSIREDSGELRMAFGATSLAEQMFAYQVLGHIERLLELSGARDLGYRFASKTWEGDEATTLEFKWSLVASEKKVRGVQFLDVVKLIKSRKDINWKEHLSAYDMSFLEDKIIETDWYPFDTFERMIEAMLKEVVKGEMEELRKWGGYALEATADFHQALVAKGDPGESLMRFQVLNRGLFNFDPIKPGGLSDGRARLEMDLGMRAAAEEASTYQAIGFIERLLALSGAKDVSVELKAKAWEGDRFTILEFTWSV